MNIKTDSFEIDVVERINQLEREVSGQGAKLDAINDNIARLVANADRPTNWIGIGSLIIAMFSVTMGFMTIVTSGTNEKLSEHSEILALLVPTVSSGTAKLEEYEEQTEDLQKDVKQLLVKMGMLDGMIKVETKGNK